MGLSKVGGWDEATVGNPLRSVSYLQAYLLPHRRTDSLTSMGAARRAPYYYYHYYYYYYYYHYCYYSDHDY